MRISLGIVVLLAASAASACPNLSGRYRFQPEPGSDAAESVIYTLRQNGCQQVDVTMSVYLHPGDKQPAEFTQQYIPDGKKHGEKTSVSEWVGNRLQVGKPSDHIYYQIDSAGTLHFSNDAISGAKCKAPCDYSAQRISE